jgi:arginase family enzyme
VKKPSYKRGPRFGPDMIKQEQPTQAPLVEKSIQPAQAPVVDEKKEEIVEKIDTIETTTVEQLEEVKVVVEPTVEKQQETTKTASDKRRR